MASNSLALKWGIACKLQTGTSPLLLQARKGLCFSRQWHCDVSMAWNGLVLVTCPEALELLDARLANNRFVQLRKSTTGFRMFYRGLYALLHASIKNL
jgi:hypothetical protein